MHTVLWAVQILLAGGFFSGGAMKLFQSPEKLAEMWPWAADHPGLVTLTGIVDILAGIGLIFPGLLRVQPKLTVYTAFGVILLMLSAALFHITRGEASDIGVNIVFAAMAAFVAWGRLGKAPLSGKN
ncbi:MAG TPA: DoxX family protein [Anseongella sp.]